MTFASGTGPIKPGGWCPHHGDICHVIACGHRNTCVDGERAWEAKQTENKEKKADG